MLWEFFIIKSNIKGDNKMGRKFKKPIQIGQVYKTKDSFSSKYLLVGFPFNKKNYATLISLYSGNRWHDLIEVEDIWNISEEEFKKISDNYPFEFHKYIKNIIFINPIKRR